MPQVSQLVPASYAFEAGFLTVHAVDDVQTQIVFHYFDEDTASDVSEEVVVHYPVAVVATAFDDAHYGYVVD